MENKHIILPILPKEMILLGDGASYQDMLCDMLAKAQGFEHFERPELRFLAKHVRAYHAPAGITIFRERDKNSHLGVLVSGRICVYKDDSSDTRKLLGFVTAGRIFGEVSVIDDLPYSATLTTDSESTILLMSRESFHQCIADNSIFGVRLLKLIARLLASRLRTTSGQLVDYIDVK